MSLSHHSGKQPELIKRFLEQMNGTGPRAYPAGRMGAEDDGELTYAMATDDKHRTIIIKFPKPVEWIGMGVKEAEELRDQLTERLVALRTGINV